MICNDISNRENQVCEIKYGKHVGIGLREPHYCKIIISIQRCNGFLQSITPNRLLEALLFPAMYGTLRKTKGRIMRFRTILGRIALPSLAMALSLALAAPSAQAETVKLSASGICHDAGSAWYGRTKKFTAFPDMAACLAQGRPYSGWSSGEVALLAPAARPSTPSVAGGRYDRDLYGDWIDEDGDCLNTRHEVLASLSTGTLAATRDGCRVLRGRWNDPYTGRIFLEAGDLDIDHMVPLAWAHARGAAAWDGARKRDFANDPVNLFAVEAAANRQKGAKGPLEWLPPNVAYRCEYVTRFHRLVVTFGLEYLPGEAGAMEALRTRLCG